MQELMESPDLFAFIGRVWDTMGKIQDIHIGISVDVLPGIYAGASTSAVPLPMKGLGTVGILLDFWALRPARLTPIRPRRERRGFSALLVNNWGRALIASIESRSSATTRTNVSQVRSFSASAMNDPPTT